MKLEGLEYLAMSAEEIKFHFAKKVIEKPLKAFIARIRDKKLKNSMATLI